MNQEQTCTICQRDFNPELEGDDICQLCARDLEACAKALNAVSVGHHEYEI